VIGLAVMTSTAGQFKGLVSHAGGVAVVRCCGEIDMGAAEAFRALLDQAIAASPTLVVDFGGVTFLDSSGLRVLAVTAVRAGRSLAIRNPTPSVARVLELSQMDQFIAMVPDQQRIRVEP